MANSLTSTSLHGLETAGSDLRSFGTRLAAAFGSMLNEVRGLMSVRANLRADLQRMADSCAATDAPRAAYLRRVATRLDTNHFE